MLARLVSLIVAFALGLAAATSVDGGDRVTRPPLRLVGLVERDADWVEEDERRAWRDAAAPLVARATRRLAARGSDGHEDGHVDRVWHLDPQPGFPGGRIIDGTFPHRASCEADRADLRVVAFTTAGGPTSAVALVNADPRDVRVLRAGGDEALVVMQGRTFRAGSSVELLAWDLARGAIDEVARWTSGGSVTWSLEADGAGAATVLRVHGGRLEAPFDPERLAERVGISIVRE